MTTRALDTANENPEQSGSWSGVLAIAVCAFALVASEFLPVSLLTPIANDWELPRAWQARASPSPAPSPF